MGREVQAPAFGRRVEVDYTDDGRTFTVVRESDSDDIPFAGQT
jgi:hypothetical protein